MANETRPPCEVAAEAAKTVDPQVCKIHNPDDFGRITRGIKVARCMQSPSSYGEPRPRECLTGGGGDHDNRRTRLFTFRAAFVGRDGDGRPDWVQKV